MSLLSVPLQWTIVFMRTQTFYLFMIVSIEPRIVEVLKYVLDKQFD